MATGDLTTVTKVKSFAGISASTYDTLLAALVSQVSNQIALYCDRTFESTAYYSWIDGNGSRFLRLPQYPITLLNEVAIDYVECGYIKNTSAKQANVSYDGTTFSLYSISTAGAESSSTLARATYKILSTLEAAVEAVSGWSMEVYSGYSDVPTTHVRPVYGASATSPDMSDIECPYNRSAVTLATEDSIEIKDYAAFPEGIANIFVRYTAGYTLVTDDAAGTEPTALILAANQIIMDVFGARTQSSAFQSETIGDYSYNRGSINADILSAIRARKAMLDPFIRRVM